MMKKYFFLLLSGHFLFLTDVMGQKKLVKTDSSIQSKNFSSALIDKYNVMKYKIDRNTELKKGIIHLKIVHGPVKNYSKE